ncbi:hypothetical protein ACVWYN_003747 [Pedobacter sp. UYP24]
MCASHIDGSRTKYITFFYKWPDCQKVHNGVLDILKIDILKLIQLLEHICNKGMKFEF